MRLSTKAPKTRSGDSLEHKGNMLYVVIKGEKNLRRSVSILRKVEDKGSFYEQ